jgi:two-component system, sensor histidine kinase and response regulator
MRRDLVGLGLVLAAGAASIFLFDAAPFTNWVARNKDTRLDEVICVIAVLSIGLSIFVLRRWVATTRQIITNTKLQPRAPRQDHSHAGPEGHAPAGATTPASFAERVKARMRSDLVRLGLVLAAGIVSIFLFDATPLTDWVEKYKASRADEIICVIVVLALGLCVFSMRRWLDVTRQIIANEQLHAGVLASREDIRLLLDSMAEAIYGIDLQGNCTFCNSACARLTGYDDPAELLGKNMHQVLHHTRADGAPYRQEDCKIYVSRRRSQTSHVDDEVLWRKDGSSFPAEYWSHPIYRNGEVTGSVVTFLDISARRQSQEALRKSEEKFQRLSEANVVGIMTGNLNGRILDANHAFLQMMGYMEQDLARESVRWDRMVLEEDWSFLQAVSSQLRTAGVWGPQQVSLVRKDRSRISVFMGLAVTDKDKEETIGFAINLTEREHAQAALNQANQNLSTLITASPAAIMAFDGQGKIQVWNPAAERLFGWTCGELMGHIPPIVPEEKREEFHERLRRAMEGEELPREESRRLRKDGSVVEVSISRANLHDAEGRIAGVMAVMEDITERKRYEEELQKARFAAEAASRAKSEFLANMSHEIRTPMNGVIGMTELALKTDLTRDQREYLEMARSSANSLLTVINDILDFTKIEAGKLDLDPIAFNIRDTVEDTARMLALKADQKGLELITDVQGNVPQVGVGDPLRLRQVLFNLLGNAVKFTEKGEVVLAVKVEEATQGQVRLGFSVKDTGIGIPQGRQRAIFDAFTQADNSTTRNYSGTGLGLAISSRLVHMMGGEIWVESEMGKGSIFNFTGTFGIGSAEAEAPAPDSVDLRNLPIMVVDDNETSRTILRQTLKNWGMQPTMVDGAREALAVLEQAQKSGKPFPLVITDMHMPDMDGFALAEQIKSNPSLAQATIMMLTSSGHHGDITRCRQLGVKAYLTKPVKQSELLHAIAVSMSSLGGLQPAGTLVTRQSLDQTIHPLRILVAEDNRVNQVLVRRLLEQRGHTVVVAGNGLEALARLETSSFDMVLMDVQMPEMDGFEATRAIREKERSGTTRLPIIALTAHAMKGDQERCLAAGMDGYVSKPLQPAELFATIECFAHAGMP